MEGKEDVDREIKERRRERMERKRTVGMEVRYE